MRILFINFASRVGTIAICDDKSITASIDIIDHKDDALLMRDIHTLLHDAAIAWSDLTHVACVTGPGGFMKIRTGVALANAAAWTLGIPIVGIHESDLLAAMAPHAVKNFLWLHSTRKTQLFVRGFGSFSASWNEPTLNDLDFAKSAIVPHAPYVGELIDDHQSVLMVDALLLIHEALPGFLASLSYTKHIVTPWYGRGM